MAFGFGGRKSTTPTQELDNESASPSPSASPVRGPSEIESASPSPRQRPRPTAAEKLQQLQSRKEPLLGEPIRPNVGTNEINRGGCCTRIFFALIPLLSLALILSFLYILIYEGEVDLTKVSLSQAMGEFEPHHEILGVALMGSTFTIITTIAREIQIRVYFSREGAYSFCLQATNSIGSLANIIAYVGFVIAVFYEYDSEDDRRALLHVVGMLAFYALAPLYACLQSSLLFKQTQYSMSVKIVFLFVAVVEYALAIGYLVMREKAIQLQWFAFASIPLYTGLFFILFLIDPVDDELKEYFSFGCCQKNNGNGMGRESSSVNGNRSAIELA